MNFYILLTLSYVPLLFYLVDGYYDKNIKKGILFIVSFLILMGVTSFLIKKFDVYIAVIFPLLFVMFLLFIRPKQKKD